MADEVQEQPPPELVVMAELFKKMTEAEAEGQLAPTGPPTGAASGLSLAQMFRIILKSEGEAKAMAFLKEVNRFTAKPRSAPVAALKARWAKKRKEKMIRQLGGK